MNVIFLSMARCGISWIGDTLKEVYKQLYGKELQIHYENDRAMISNTLVEGWHSVYDVDLKVLLKLGYDKVLIIKRDLETMKEAHAKFHGYFEIYDSYEAMQQERPAFFERIEKTYDLLYNQELDDPRIIIISLEDLNNYTHDTFNEIIQFLDFKLSLLQKIKLFLRILRNKIKPFVIPTRPPKRNWDVFSAILPKGTPVCNRLQFIDKLAKQLEKEVKI